ncbi:MAG: cell division protein [Planctomycetes bacterium]|nr:cell division protein [Planctomycetota bacterium]
MLLTGSFHRLLDEKLRFAIPKPLRDAVGDPEESVLYVAPGTDGSLALFPPESFAKLASRLEQGSDDGRDVVAFSRLFYAQVQRIELDKQGRVRLPIELAELAGLRKEIVLLGVRDHLEIWNREIWEDYLQRTQPHYDQLAASALAGGAAATASTAGESAMGSSSVTRPAHPK